MDKVVEAFHDKKAIKAPGAAGGGDAGVIKATQI